MKVEQCQTCPWKKETKCENIPNYDPQLHESLRETIAGSDGNLSKINQPIKIMACHYSTETENIHCAGWLHNQLGVGNNIQLRLSMRNDNISEILIDGEQVESFDETFK